MNQSRNKSKNTQSLPKIAGLRFKNPKLLAAALRHPSCQEPLPRNQSHDFNRLEFLGDSILNYAISRKMFSLFKNSREGEMSRYRAFLVSRKTLAEISKKLSLENYIKTGKMTINSSGLEDKIVADTLEAIIAAVYLDQGLDKALAFIWKIFKPYWPKDSFNLKAFDPKTALQEICQRRWKKLPEYAWLQHADKIECIVRIEGFEVRSEGRSKKLSAESAAAILLSQISL